MKSYIYNLPNTNDTIGMALVVHCGSMNEKKEQRGFSHLLEHMLISFDKFDYNQEINCSGYTDFYYTYFSFLTTQKHVKECIKYVKQIMCILRHPTASFAEQNGRNAKLIGRRPLLL